MNATVIDNAVTLLRTGGVIAFPTETVYGLGADAENSEAVRRIFSIKGRPADHPLIVHLAESDMIDRWAQDVPDTALRLAERFWPGPLTIVLRRSSRVSDLVTGGLDTVGIRVPAHPVAHSLLKSFRGGIAAPSANRFGRISPTSTEHVREELGLAPDLILDGDDCQVGFESTIISLAGDRPVLLRPGGISISELCEIIGEEIVFPGKPDPEMRAPGCHASHYAPLTPAITLSTEELAAVARRLNSTGQNVAVLCRTATVLKSCQMASCPTASCIMMPSDPGRYGQLFYSSLRRLDVGGHDIILIETPPETEQWQAITDRILRATRKPSKEYFSKRRNSYEQSVSWHSDG